MKIIDTSPRLLRPGWAKAMILLALGLGGALGSGAAEPPRNPADHWAFKKPVRTAPPKIRNEAWPKNPVDQFVLARLEKTGIAPSPEADRRTLVRRVTFDLTGLPPTPEEVQTFLADSGDQAYERLVDRLLASPHYGERWGQYWLEAVGYSDSNGYFNADSERPLAHKYRDYVVNALNADKPFDRFLSEQVAGDELCGLEPDGDVTPAMVEPLTATHLFRNAPDGTGESDGNPLEVKVDRYSVLEGNVQILGSALLGLTLQCARCHNHKFEPVTQEEYYQLQAILRPVFNPEKWLKPNERTVTVGTRAEREAHSRLVEKLGHEAKARKESVEGLVAPLRKLLLAENLATLDEAARKSLRAALDAKEKDRNAEMKALLKKHDALVRANEEDLARRFPDLKATLQALNEAAAKTEREKPGPLPQLAVMSEPGGPLPAHHILTRGNYANEGKEVAPGVPAVLCLGENSYKAEPAGKSSGRRLALARWLTSPSNPLVARVFVNRVWQRHFGEGIAATVDNLGVTGSLPSHPELLDFLASEFVASGWKMKALHRLLVTSATYRQSGALRPEAFQADPNNVLLWRHRARRLDSDALRDALFAASGELRPKLGGAFIPVTGTPEGQFVVSETAAEANRRTIYLQHKRTATPTFLDVFDGSQIGLNCTRRSSSTVPLQSLALLNSDFSRARSRALAGRLLAEKATAEPSARVERVFQIALARGPNEEERDAALGFLASQSAYYPSGREGEQKVWTDLCQMLLASNAFLYVE